MANVIVGVTKITDDMLIDFTPFSITSLYSATEHPLLNLEASSNLINFALRQTPWTPYRYLKGNIYYTGYGTKKDINTDGMLETTAYSFWLEDFKNVEKNFKRLLPLDTLTQNQYDALLSLYYFTGEWGKVGSTSSQINIKQYILDKKWDYVATALINSGSNRVRTQTEAKMIMLGNYGRYTDRALLKSTGLSLIEKNYPDYIEDTIAKRQAEYIYYAETRKFLPGVSQTRKKQIERDFANSTQSSNPAVSNPSTTTNAGSTMLSLNDYALKTSVPTDVNQLTDASALLGGGGGGAGSGVLPKGTTAQRPASPVQGQMYFNTETVMFEGYNGTTWITIIPSTLQQTP
jgi:hypothetical protein|tara:strand:+ start:4895 stop:5935 length:1041 start_codon:yes stop_codon:yes gene_type:complete